MYYGSIRKKQQALKVCSVLNCEAPYYKNGYCRLHYDEMLWDGSVSTPPLRKGLDGKYHAIKHKSEYCGNAANGQTNKRAHNKGAVCIEAGCNEPAFSKGYCRKHYNKQYIEKRSGSVYLDKICLVEGCKEPAVAKGLCKVHYLQRLPEKTSSTNIDATALRLSRVNKPAGNIEAQRGSNKREGIYAGGERQERTISDDIKKSEKICLQPGCSAPARVKGFCKVHYSHYWYAKKRRAEGHAVGEEIIFNRQLKCSVDGCSDSVYAKGLCKSHYQRKRRIDKNIAEGKLAFQIMSNKNKLCAVEGCKRKAFTKGLCQSHYRKFRYAEKVAREAANKPEKNRKCSVEGCDRYKEVRGLCRMHYARLRRRGIVDNKTRYENKGKICSVEGCRSSAYSKGLCQVHYLREWRQGRKHDS